MLATASIKIFDVVVVATTSNVIIPVEGEGLWIIKFEYSTTRAIVTTLWVLSSRHYEYLVDDAIMYTRVLYMLKLTGTWAFVNMISIAKIFNLNGLHDCIQMNGLQSIGKMEKEDWTIAIFFFLSNLDRKQTEISTSKHIMIIDCRSS